MNEITNTGSSQGAFAPEPRVYELGYLVMPTVDEGNLSTERDALVALITRHNGIVIDEGNPVLIDLAYSIDKMIKNKKNTFTQGYFGWIKFDAAPGDVEALTAEVEKQDSLIRFLMVKTVRENTLTSDQPFRVAKTSHDSLEEYEESNDVVVETNNADDLTKIEGIGPVIAETLNEAGITTFESLADTDIDTLKERMEHVRGSHDPQTWGQQAALARDGKWEELDELQEELKGGKAS